MDRTSKGVITQSQAPSARVAGSLSLSLSLSLSSSIRISETYGARVARQLRPGDSGARGISARHRSRNIGAPLEATGSLNWVSKDVTLRWKRDAITGTASYRDSSRGYRQSRQGMERRRGNGRVDGGGGGGRVR